MNPVVVKIPPPMMLLTSTQEAVNQPIFCAADFKPGSLIDGWLMAFVGGRGSGAFFSPSPSLPY